MTYLATLGAALAGPLDELTDYNQFILFKMEYNADLGKYDKVPYSRSGVPADPHASVNWMTAQDAMKLCSARNASAGCDLYGVGFVLTKTDDLFCLDIDNGLTADGEEKAQTTAICDWLPGAAVEVSINGHGYHVWGRGELPYNHGTQYVNDEQGIKFELFSHSRFIALTGTFARGSAALEQPNIFELQRAMFREVSQSETVLSGSGPVEEWHGPEDDDELLNLMYKLEPPQTLAPAAHDGKPNVNFGDISSFNTAVLNARYPATSARADGLGCDMSDVDYALARKLAYYTGKDASRMERLMRRMPWAAHREAKWATRLYMQKTFNRAAASVQTVFGANYIDPVMVERGRMLLANVLAPRTEAAVPLTGALLLGEDGLDAEPDGWLIDGVLPTVGLGTIVGAPGSGKTFLAMDIALSLSQGHTAQWFGRDIEAHVPVTHVVLEDSSGVVQRLKAWKKHNNRTINRKFARYQAPLNLFTQTDGSLTPLIAALTSAELTHGVVIIDTFACATAGMEENSAKDMGIVMSAARALADATQSLVLLVHHTTKADGTLRGSTALEGAMDVIIKVERKKLADDSYEHTWTLDKSKQGPVGARGTFRLRALPVGVTPKGKTITSCVVAPLDQQLADQAVRGDATGKAGKGKDKKDPLDSLNDRPRIAYDVLCELTARAPNNTVHPDHPCVHWTTFETTLRQRFTGLGVTSNHMATRISEALSTLYRRKLVDQLWLSDSDRYFFVEAIRHDTESHRIPLTA